MRILQLGKYYPPVWGGIEAVTAALTRGFARHGVQNDVLVSTNGKDDEELLDIPGASVQSRIIRVANAAIISSAPVSLRYITKFREIAPNYDVVIIHAPNPLAFTAQLFSGYGGKVVLFWHSDIVRQKWLLKLYHSLQDAIIKRADLIVGPTPAHVEESDRTSLFHGKTAVIPFPVSEDLFELAKLGINGVHPISQKPKITVLAVGRLVYYKGFDYLVRAAAALPERFQILVGGEGPDYAALAALIDELHLQERVRLLGSLTHDQLMQHYRNCDIVCLPSVERAEMFGLVQLEAMAHGKPVVSTLIQRSGVRYVNRDGETGLVVPPADPAALAEALRRLAEDDTLYAKAVAAGPTTIMSHYDPDAVAAAHVQHYRRLLG